MTTKPRPTPRYEIYGPSEPMWVRNQHIHHQPRTAPQTVTDWLMVALLAGAVFGFLFFIAYCCVRTVS